MQDTRNCIQVFGLKESHCNSSVINEQLASDRYEIIRKDGSKRKGGGVLCYIRNR